jgi:hypothetical protein
MFLIYVSVHEDHRLIAQFSIALGVPRNQINEWPQPFFAIYSPFQAVNQIVTVEERIHRG